MAQNPNDLVRSVYWQDGRVCMIDQQQLPQRFEIRAFDNYLEVSDVIRTMVVRGAPAIGAAGFGMALAVRESGATTVEELRANLRRAGDVLGEVPTDGGQTDADDCGDGLRFRQCAA